MEGFAQNGRKTKLYGPKRAQKPEKQEILKTGVHGIQEVGGSTLRTLSEPLKTIGVQEKYWCSSLGLRQIPSFKGCGYGKNRNAEYSEIFGRLLL